MYVFCVPQGYNQHGHVVLDGFSGIADAEYIYIYLSVNICIYI